MTLSTLLAREFICDSDQGMRLHSERQGLEYKVDTQGRRRVET
jgi:hypothetical protein